MPNNHDTLRRAPVDAPSSFRSSAGIRLVDMTLRPHAGAKGRGLPSFLEGMGYSIGRSVNEAYRQTDGSLVALLSPTEVLWLGGAQSDTDDLSHWHRPDGQPLAQDTYLVPRADGTYWFRLVGEGVVAKLSSLCSLDFSVRAFAELQIAQILMARVSVIVVREEVSGETGFHVLGDISLAAYMWEILTQVLARE